MKIKQQVFMYLSLGLLAILLWGWNVVSKKNSAEIHVPIHVHSDGHGWIDTSDDSFNSHHWNSPIQIMKLSTEKIHDWPEGRLEINIHSNHAGWTNWEHLEHHELDSHGMNGIRMTWTHNHKSWIVRYRIKGVGNGHKVVLSDWSEWHYNGEEVILPHKDHVLSGIEAELIPYHK